MSRISHIFKVGQIIEFVEPYFDIQVGEIGFVFRLDAHNRAAIRPLRWNTSYGSTGYWVHSQDTKIKIIGQCEP